MRKGKGMADWEFCKKGDIPRLRVPRKPIYFKEVQNILQTFQSGIDEGRGECLRKVFSSREEGQGLHMYLWRFVNRFDLPFEVTYRNHKDGTCEVFICPITAEEAEERKALRSLRRQAAQAKVQILSTIKQKRNPWNFQESSKPSAYLSAGLKCPKCAYQWIPRRKNPKKCPACAYRLKLTEKALATK